MINFSETMDIISRINDIKLDLYSMNFYDESLEKERQELEARLELLQTQDDEYRDGYSAGVEYHLGSGRDARDSDSYKSRFWYMGFDQAGQDS